MTSLLVWPSSWQSLLRLLAPKCHLRQRRVIESSDIEIKSSVAAAAAVSVSPVLLSPVSRLVMMMMMMAAVEHLIVSVAGCLV